jgi:hypothetical protein
MTIVAMQVVLHLHNEDPFIADLEALPDPHSNYIRVTNPRKRDGKAINTLTNGATSFLYPWTRITFLEILEDGESQANDDKLMGFFREGSSARR